MVFGWTGLKLRAFSQPEVSAQRLFAWHCSPGALARLVPAWESVRMLGQDEGLWEGLQRQLQVSPLRLAWCALHEHFVPGVQFVDRQLRGPFPSWRHKHEFQSGLLDEIDFELPFRPLSWVALPALRAQMKCMFLYRHRMTAFDLSFPPVAPLRIGITGASGTVGRALTAFLRAQGHQVQAAIRREDSYGMWDPQQFEDLDVLVHLAGKGVMDGNFGVAHKAEIERSRIWATEKLVKGLLALKNPPRAVVSASGNGYYGQPLGLCDEASPPGQDFLARVCQGWEAALWPLSRSGIRWVALRIAPVLHLSAGMLPILYWSSRLGCSGRFGEGKQPLSWISLDDMLGLIYHSICQEHWQGPINAAAPEISTLGHLSRRVAPCCPQVSIPEACLKLLVGARAELFLAGNHLSVHKALSLGYKFAYPELEGALRHALGRYTQEDWPARWEFQLV